MHYRQGSNRRRRSRLVSSVAKHRSSMRRWPKGESYKPSSTSSLWFKMNAQLASWKRETVIPQVRKPQSRSAKLTVRTAGKCCQRGQSQRFPKLVSEVVIFFVERSFEARSRSMTGTKTTLAFHRQARTTSQIILVTFRTIRLRWKS